MTCSRRAFLVGLGAAPIFLACRGESVTATPIASADAFTLDGAHIIVRVDRLPALQQLDQPVVLLAARIIVVRSGPDAYRALSVECPHSGCAVSNVVGQRLVCPCHGSEFDASGRRLAGPAPTGLAALDVTFDASVGLLRVLRVS